MSALAATFSDIKTVKSRSVCQLVLEIPIEQADAALSVLGGMPKPGAEVWVGIARLKTSPEWGEAAVPAHGQDDARESADGESPSSRRRFRDLAPAVQAALRCAERDFQQWLGVQSEESAAALVRIKCGVKSRRDLNTDQKAAATWHTILTDYDMKDYAR